MVNSTASRYSTVVLPYPILRRMSRPRGAVLQRGRGQRAVYVSYEIPRVRTNPGREVVFVPTLNSGATLMIIC